MNTGEKQKHAGEEEPNAETGKRENGMSSVSKWWHDPAHVLQAIGILIGSVVAIIYGCQLRAMNDTVRITRKNSELDERAWVSINLTDPLRVIKNEPLGFKFKLINSGKTPARSVEAGIWVEVVPICCAPDLSETGVRMIAERGDLFPNIIPDIADDIHAVRQRSTTPRSSSTEDWPLSESESGDFGAGRNYVVAYVMVSYYDIFHIKHWTKHCVYHAIPSVSPPVANCAAYDGEDDNEEP